MIHLQGLIKFIFDCLHGVSHPPSAFSLSLSLLAGLQYLAFFYRRRSFFLVRSFIHPNVGKLYTVKLETANGAHFPLHAVPGPSPLLPSHTILRFPLRATSFYFHFIPGNGKVCYYRKIGWKWFLNWSAPVYFIPCQFVSNRTKANLAGINRSVEWIRP